MDIDLLGENTTTEKPEGEDFGEFILPQTQNAAKQEANQEIQQKIRKQSDEVWVQSIQEQGEQEQKWEVAQVSQAQPNAEVQAVKENEANVNVSDQVQTQKQVNHPKSEEIIEDKVEDKVENPVENKVEITEVQSNEFTQSQNLAKPTQVHEVVQPEAFIKPAEDDDDDFGDYEQSSAPTTSIAQSQPIQPISQEVKWINNDEHKGEENVLKDLQSFVDKLPDYSYLFKLAFVE